LQSAVSPIFNRQACVRERTAELGWTPAGCKAAIQQVANLRYAGAGVNQTFGRMHGEAN
jgi:hypothetical protein